VPTAFAVTLIAYTAIAVARAWWPSAVAAPVLAWLLWRRHPRARFAAYVFFSVMTVRAILTASWPLGAFALGRAPRVASPHVEMAPALECPA
jgi:hypothetical protein